jgi:hypothetical protein
MTSLTKEFIVSFFPKLYKHYMATEDKNIESESYIKVMRSSNDVIPKKYNVHQPTNNINEQQKAKNNLDDLVDTSDDDKKPAAKDPNPKSQIDKEEVEDTTNDDEKSVLIEYNDVIFSKMFCDNKPTFNGIEEVTQKN